MALERCWLLWMIAVCRIGSPRACEIVSNERCIPEDGLHHSGPNKHHGTTSAVLSANDGHTVLVDNITSSVCEDPP